MKILIAIFLLTNLVKGMPTCDLPVDSNLTLSENNGTLHVEYEKAFQKFQRRCLINAEVNMKTEDQEMHYGFDLKIIKIMKIKIDCVFNNKTANITVKFNTLNRSYRWSKNLRLWSNCQPDDDDGPGDDPGGQPEDNKKLILVLFCLFGLLALVLLLMKRKEVSQIIIHLVRGIRTIIRILRTPAPGSWSTWSTWSSNSPSTSTTGTDTDLEDLVSNEEEVEMENISSNDDLQITSDPENPETLQALIHFENEDQQQDNTWSEIDLEEPNRIWIEIEGGGEEHQHEKVEEGPRRSSRLSDMYKQK